MNRLVCCAAIVGLGGVASAQPAPEIVPPALIADSPASYPEQAVADHVAAAVAVTLVLSIDTSGAVANASVEAPQGHGFDEAALAAARQLRFSPATRDGNPVAVKIKFRYEFPPPAPRLVGRVVGANGGAPLTAVPVAAAADALDVTVHGEKPPREVTRRTLTNDEIAEIPGTNGDAIKSLLNLPGVARPPLISGALIVRGSAPIDTGIYIDQIRVPIVYHFGGLSSVIPTELVDTLAFAPGNFSAAYGRGMGGVVDVGLRAPKTDGLHAMAESDFIDVRGLVEGPLGHGFRALAAARQSYFDLWLTPILDRAADSFSSAPRYDDYQLELAHDAPGSSLRLVLLGSNDSIALTAPQGVRTLDQSFWRAIARYDTRLGNGGELVASVGYGADATASTGGTSFAHATTDQLSARAELSERIATGVEAHTGIDVDVAPYTVALRRPAPTAPGVPAGSPDQPPVDATASATLFQPAMYTEWELTPWSGARIVPGLRVDYDRGSMTWDVSPRLTLRQDLGAGFPRTTLKAGVGVYDEPLDPTQIDLVTGNAAVTGTSSLTTQRSVQYDVGFERQLTQQVDVSTDVFYKSLDRLLVPGVGNVGDGYTYGAELLLRYNPDERLFGWLSYTYARSMRRDAAELPLYAYDFDQPSVLTVLASYKLGGGWQVGGRFRLTSGDPYTPDGYGAYDAAASRTLPVGSTTPNTSRLPAFAALDVRVDHTWQFRRWKLVGYLDISNVTDAGNPEAVTYNYNFTQSQYATGLPILPSFGLRGEL